MYKYILAEGGDINWMALFALITFFVVFLISIVTVIGKKNFYQKMAELPLDDNDKTFATDEK